MRKDSAIKQCQQCNKPFTSKKYEKEYEKIFGKKRSSFCSRECFINHRYGEVITDGEFYARSEAGLLALKLCSEGLLAKEAAARAGITARVLSNEILRNKGFFDKRICIECGKSLVGMPRIEVRKYCSETCGTRHWRKLNHERIRNLEHEKKLIEREEFKENVLALHLRGYSVNEIVVCLDSSMSRVTDYVSKYGNHNEKHFRKERELADSADKWLAVLREYAKKGGYKSLCKSRSYCGNDVGDCCGNDVGDRCENDTGKSHILICKPMSGNAGNNHLITTISDYMEHNPYNGDTYVFRSCFGGLITAITWDGIAFSTIKYSRNHYTYIWPHEGVGKFVPVTEDDFKFILTYYKNNQASRRKYFEGVRKSVDISNL